MENLAFALWMVLWLPCSAASDYLTWIINGKPPISKKLREATALVIVIVWIVVGIILY